ncbi:PREDICTED: D-tyrosyl-tRNA(Tyr) deacylase isoform X5 [Wasmannia auropunctata]|nr:PREDICTED: D-tyrosyl-tRNA(Tyr) deacylase isoform X5 [Wasmannia auropunctata]
MKAIIQRVSKASVSVDGEVISSIGNGLCVLVGIKRDDGAADMKYM